MSVGNIKQYGVGGTLNRAELNELQDDGEISKRIDFRKYDIDNDGRIEQKEVDKIEGRRTESNHGESRRSGGGSVDIAQEGEFGHSKTLRVGEGTHYVVIHTSHGNDTSKDIGSITGKGVSIVSESGNGDNGIIIAKVNGPSSVRIDSNKAGAAQYAVIKGSGDITAFGGDDPGYPKTGDWTKVNVSGDAFYIAKGHVGTPTFYSTERDRIHGNTVTARS